MKVGEWYTNPSDSKNYIIRITAVNTESDQRDGEWKVYNYFAIAKNKSTSTKENEAIDPGYKKIKEPAQLKKLEQFYRQVSGPAEGEQLDSFIKTLGDIGGNGSN